MSTLCAGYVGMHKSMDTAFIKYKYETEFHAWGR